MHRIYLYPMRLIYPPRCTFCECIIPLSVDQLLCDECEEDYPCIEESLCQKCGKQINTENYLCNDCSIAINFYEKGIALYPYDGMIKEALYRFKYGGRRKYAQFFAQMMVKQLEETDFYKEIDLIVPVPISKERRIQRGYNQTEELARYISKHTKIPWEKDILTRTKHTKPQSSFDPGQRRQNIKNAFQCIYSLDYKVILIIDDIYTTGSTINECARILKEAGAQKVYSAVVCIGN